ncbi:MAG: YmdB family metallophosphoesterase [Clostridia bacterium]|nr:YmdB family metallophosphoesterase [Clostridia bacterium]
MKILAIGDITGIGGVKHLESNLWRIRDREHIDLTIVNVENAGFITGPSPDTAERVLAAGADVLTGGNHTLRNKAIYSYLDSEPRVLRPLNFGPEAPGEGYTIVNINGYRVMVVSAMGNVHIEPCLDSPFDHIERALRREEGRYDIALLDIHAEATGEKMAVAYAFDGRISAVFGTHTHVQTADEQILPGGTGYISDLGMCGETMGILGMEPESVVKRMRTHLPIRFEPAQGKPRADGVIITVDERSRKTTEIKRISF